MGPFSFSKKLFSLSTLALLAVFLFCVSSNAFYLPSSYMHTYIPGGIKRSAENLGELLMGDQIDNSPYQFHVNVNESLYLCTTNALNEHEVKLLKQRTHDLYQVNMILDNLQAMLKLNMYDKVESVSCPLELDKSQTIREQEKISFTYEIVFVKSDIRWPSRWDAYLKNNISEVVLGVRACRGHPAASCARRWLAPSGSEHFGKIEVEGERLKESQFINKSLSTLGDVISALASKNPHISYRDWIGLTSSFEFANLASLVEKIM
ncbi:hypothetical protein ZIOFF_048228 [Zingiber officinale]|uniref:Transmembrane 9 superfamily member n=1 Tax=Zingiber officinale TaxID=94328 RepID=A0A8J5FYV8_ZINOF|nr:hypothetical protein ZIOFF_048228 [Zingiber officinale]